uniref:Mitochondrial ribosomal protein L32 n=1 Tax=Lepisosteus oculatus TaxID=7918 RepID=W5MSK4_LEPOC|nr:PREDICTED: 39S ribosomal protein L32, mitochondrial [Lepisosteus oculatus]
MVWLRTSGFLCFLRRSLINLELRILQIAGFDRNLAPAWAVEAPCLLPEPQSPLGQAEDSGFRDSVFWMAAPKKRRTIEVNRCRRRNPANLIPVKVLAFASVPDVNDMQAPVVLWVGDSPQLPAKRERV